MTTIFIGRRVKADPAKVLASKRRVLSNSNRVAFAEKISRWCWKPLKKYSVDGVLDPMNKNQLATFLLNQIFPEFGRGVYQMTGTVNGMKKFQYFGTYAIYSEGDVLKVCSWDVLKEHCLID